MSNPLLQKIAEEFGISNLPEEKREELIARIGGIVYQAVLVRALEAMSEGEQDEFEKMLDADKEPGELFAYLESKVPNISTIIAEEVARFKQEADSMMNALS